MQAIFKGMGSQSGIDIESPLIYLLLTPIRLKNMQVAHFESRAQKDDFIKYVRMWL